jgi:hypothetical protein
MALGIALLLTEDPRQAREIAQTLEQINSERRAVQQSMTDDAEQALTRVVLDMAGQRPVAACLFDADWHPGVVGLVASKMKDRLHRPVIAFAPAEPGADTLRGSARSIPGLHIRDALALVDARHPGLIERFGGHAMAAGLSLRLTTSMTSRPPSSPWCWKCSTRRHCSSRCSATANWPRTSSTIAMPMRCAWPGRGARASPSRCSTATSKWPTGAC